MNKTQDPEDSSDRPKNRATALTANETVNSTEIANIGNTVSSEWKPESHLGNITAKAWEIMSKKARDNAERENTAVVAELGGEDMVFRIFRRRHTNGDPLVEADRWIREIMNACTGHERGTEGHCRLDRGGRRERTRRHHRAGDHRQRRDRAGQFPTDLDPGSPGNHLTAGGKRSRQRPALLTIHQMFPQAITAAASQSKVPTKGFHDSPRPSPR